MSSISRLPLAGTFRLLRCASKVPEISLAIRAISASKEDIFLITKLDRKAPVLVTDGIKRLLSPDPTATSILGSSDILSMIETNPETGRLELTVRDPVVLEICVDPTKVLLTFCI